MTTKPRSSSPNESERGPRRARTRVAPGLVAFALLSLSSPTARADEPRADDPCATVAKQYVVSPSGSSLNALATCHERAGRTASAWAEYLEATTLAHREKRPEVELAAKHHAKALEPKLTRLVIVVPKDADLPDLDVRRDGVPMDRAAWGTALPIDPGDHVVVATAPGRKTWTRKAVLKPGAYTTTIEVGPLTPAAQAATAPSSDAVGTTSLTSASYDAPEGSTRNRGGAQRAVGITLMGVGLAGVALGTYFGLQTLSKSDAAEAACPSSPCADRSAIALNEDAKRAGTISTVSFAAAGGLLLAGSIVFFTAPKNGPRVSVSTSPSFAGVSLGGAF